MSIAAWMTDAKMIITNDKSEQAYQAIKSAYSSNIIHYNGDQVYLNELLSQPDLGAFFERKLYAVERKEDAITVTIAAVPDKIILLIKPVEKRPASHAS